MIDKHFISLARELLVFAMPAAVLLAVWGGADKQRKAVVLQDGSVEFTPNRRSFLAWPILVAYMVYATLSRGMHIQGSPVKLMIAVLVGILTTMFAVSFPETIIVTSDGLRQVCWLWKNKRLRWKDIVEINTGEKARTVTIAGSDGTKIVHSHILPDRARLLIELRHHCGENLPSDFLQESTTNL